MLTDVTSNALPLRFGKAGAEGSSGYGEGETTCLQVNRIFTGVYRHLQVFTGKSNIYRCLQLFTGKSNIRNQK